MCNQEITNVENTELLNNVTKCRNILNNAIIKLYTSPETVYNNNKIVPLDLEILEALIKKDEADEWAKKMEDNDEPHKPPTFKYKLSLKYAKYAIKKVINSPEYTYFCDVSDACYLFTFDKLIDAKLVTIHVQYPQFTKALKKSTDDVQLIFEPSKPIIDHAKKLVNKFIESPFITLDVKPNPDFLELFKEFVIKIQADGDLKLANFIFKWCANVVRGNRNDTAIVNVSKSQGIGKSTLAVIISKLIHLSMYHTMNITELEKWTINMKNKVFVTLEETSNESASTFNAATEKLKSLISAEFFGFEGKGKNSIMEKPTANYMITSNNPVTLAEGRRMCNLVLNTEWKINPNDDEKTKNFKTARWQRLNLEDPALKNGDLKAVYDFLMSFDVSNFKSQLELSKLPDGLTMCVESDKLGTVVNYIKNKYLLRNVGGRIPSKEFYEDYNEFCKGKGQKPRGLTSFSNEVKQLGINKIKSNLWYYVIDCKELIEKFKLMAYFDENELCDLENPKTVIDNVEDKEEVEIKELKSEIELILSYMTEEQRLQYKAHKKTEADKLRKREERARKKQEDEEKKKKEDEKKRRREELKRQLEEIDNE